MPERVQVRVPATTANLGPGFDAVGLALDLVNTFTFTQTGAAGLRLSARGIDAERLPLNAENLSWRAFVAACEAFGRPVPASVHLEIECGVPQAGGLGSSATAIVGGVLGAAAFCGAPLAAGRHLELCTRLEGHPDNVAPALLGGLVVTVTAEGEGGITHLQAPAPDLVCALCSPEVELSTKAARAALPESVPHRDAVFNGAHAALLVAALTTGRYDALGTAMADRLHQPYRARLIPGLEAALAAAREAGAFGACLSGAGPTALALCRDEVVAQKAARFMRRAFAAAGLSSRERVVRPRARGAEVLA